MRRRRSIAFEETDEESFINLTPLIDVVFVLLITFILLAPMLEIDSIHLANTSSLMKKGASESPLTISIRSDQSIWFRGKSISLCELTSCLKSEKSRFQGTSPQVMIDKRASFGMYQDVKNALEACGFEQMDILLQP